MTTLYRLQWRCKWCGERFVPDKPTDHLCVTCSARSVIKWYITYTAAVGLIAGWLLAQGCKAS